LHRPGSDSPAQRFFLNYIHCCTLVIAFGCVLSLSVSFTLNVYSHGLPLWEMSPTIRAYSVYIDLGRFILEDIVLVLAWERWLLKAVRTGHARPIRIYAHV
jgi:hypothetical protein